MLESVLLNRSIMNRVQIDHTFDVRVLDVKVALLEVPDQGLVVLRHLLQVGLLTCVAI